MDSIFRPDGIVVGVDPSPDARYATTWAAERAAAVGLPVHLVAARSPETEDGWDHDHLSARTTQQLHLDHLHHLRDALLATHPGLHVSVASTRRLPAAALVLAATRSRLVVLGSHGESLLRWSLGSTSHQVAVHAPCSVAIVRPGRERTHGRILVALDDPRDTAPLDWALPEAEATGAETVVVHVTDRSEEQRPDSGAGRLARDLDDVVARAAATHPQVKVRADVVPGNPVRVLLQQAGDHDLVVLGARGSGGFPGLTLGHVAGAVLQRADCTVVVAR